MLLLVLLLSAAGAAVAHEHLCPPIGDAEIAIPCGSVRAKGRCDASVQCRLLAAANATCASKLPCSVQGEACLCSDRFTCQRRLPSGKTALLLCQHEAHAKRQEALHTDDDGDDDDDDDSSGPDDDTAVFLAILGIFYAVMLCIALIYVRPGE